MAEIEYDGSPSPEQGVERITTYKCAPGCKHTPGECPGGEATPVEWVRFADYQAELKRREELEVELRREWLRNHDDSCDNLHQCASFGHSRRCYFPLPRALSGAKE